MREQKQTYCHHFPVNQTQHGETRCISTIPPSDGMLGQYAGLPPLDFHEQVPIYTLERREAI